MKHLCLVYFEGSRLDALSLAEKAQLDRDSLAYDEALRQSGHFIHAEALQSPSAARVVKRRRGQAIVTDGPFADTKEQLGGFILLETPTLDAAVELAAGIPLAGLGRIEVRPTYDIPIPDLPT